MIYDLLLNVYFKIQTKFGLNLNLNGNEDLKAYRIYIWINTSILCTEYTWNILQNWSAVALEWKSVCIQLFIRIQYYCKTYTLIQWMLEILKRFSQKHPIIVCQWKDSIKRLRMKAVVGNVMDFAMRFHQIYHCKYWFTIKNL